MASRLEDYALIGDNHTAALVAKNGSIDWVCFPRFDSGACFAALLGDDENGRWLLAPAGEVTAVRRRYLPDSLVLATEMDTAEGTVRIVDFMPPRNQWPDIVRIVEGVRGQVPMRMELVIRFDYGAITPWVRQDADRLLAIAGPDALELRTPAKTRGQGMKTVAEFTVSPGQRVPFVLTWYPSHTEPPKALDPLAELDATVAVWREWSNRCSYKGSYQEEVRSSLRVLKALTYEPTGGIVAAPTTSLPELLGSSRNWDYRFCWLRDSTGVLYALLMGGYQDEAKAWREWLLRAVAGDPARLQIMYGLMGNRRLTERSVPWLAGYEGSRPVRIGNQASEQLQLDVYGEVVDTLYQASRCGIAPSQWAWDLQRKILDFLEGNWSRPDKGIWEVRGPDRQFTHSKVMTWVAFDRAVRSVEQFGGDGPVDRWRKLRDHIHAEICARAYDPAQGSFVQSYEASALDGSLLVIPLVGFLPPSDARVRGTVSAIEKNLMHDGFVRRYLPHPDLDGLPPAEGAFLACTFWLCDNYSLGGQHEKARALFERLLTLRNDVGLLAEEYDPRTRRQLGNFPQALSHLALVLSAYNLGREESSRPADHRAT